MATDSGAPTASSTWRIDDRVAWTDLSERAVVLRLDDGDATPLALEGTAYVVWGVLVEKGPLVMDALVTQLAAEFGADPALVHHDVALLLADLRARGVLACV